MKKIDIDFVRSEIIGDCSVYDTPFGKRNLFYADYTASGRNLRFIEDKLIEIEKSYANTHTTDDYSGRCLTDLLHGAEERIKDLVGATEDYKIISVGSGSTGALKRLQEILGIYIPPHTKDRIFSSIDSLNCRDCTVLDKINIDRPVVFIGPYEHHTNELMWREAFAEIVVIELNSSGDVDTEMLERELKRNKYKNRVKYCSFSAGSNITGLLTDTYKIAEIAHKHDSYIFFDFAATAPYVDINIARDKSNYFDAIFFSPHKFLGGPGSSGILVFHEKLYRKDLSPTTAGGGTVEYVGFYDQDYTSDIETREKAGTPPILQTIKTALAMEVKNKIGIEKIEAAEERNKKMFFDHFQDHQKIVIIGDEDPEKRIPIISFNIRHKDRYLHPRLVTRLLSDLFGIQSRAGCSCAGPYGHRLLKIDNDTSQKYRNLIVNDGMSGIKPGWVRVNLHYVFTEADVRFIINAIEFIAEYGDRFLNIYKFSSKTAEWKHKEYVEKSIKFDLFSDFDIECIGKNENIENLRSGYFEEAKKIALSLKSPEPESFIKYSKNIENIKYFYHCLETVREEK